MSMSKFSGSAKVLKDLQGFAGFVAYEVCFQDDSMTESTMENIMEAQYFGDTADHDSIGLADQLVKGLGVFAGLFNEELLENSLTAVDSSSSRGYDGGGAPGGGYQEPLRSPTPTLSTSGLVLVMKPELHCLGEDKKIVVGGTYGLKLTTMLAAGLTEKASDAGGIKGRTLLKRSKEIIRNRRKALAIVYRHDSPYRNVASTGWSSPLWNVP